MDFPWYALAGLSALAFTAMVLLMRYALNSVDPENLLFYTFLIGAMLLFGKLAMHRQGMAVNVGILAVIAVIAVCSVLGNILLLQSYKTAPNPGYSEAIGAVRVILIAAVSVALFSSSLSWKGLAGIILAILGIALVLTS